MAEDKNELLMMFRDSNNQPVPADCTVIIDSSDRMADGFLIGKFFEAQNFTFAVGLQDSDSPQTDKNKNKGRHGKKDDDEDKMKEKDPNAGFNRWRYSEAGSSGKYPLDLQPFSFSRQMDRASTTFFQYCSHSLAFRSASLLRRTIVGHNKGLFTFLRIDFTDVLVIGVDWDDDDVVKETCKFICRKVDVRYRPQKHDGTLGDEVPGRWQMSSSP